VEAFTIEVSGVRSGDRVLDVAGGTADLSRAFAKRVGSQRPGLAHRHQQRHADGVGRDRLLDDGLMVPAAQCDAEKLPFPDGLLRLRQRAPSACAT
jgi:demethylmenaquinone methyltransferase/2-methoxy-6-polyprenyl-1,4-benzoquinol methylase